MGAGCAERFMSGSARASGCNSPGLLSPSVDVTRRKRVGPIWARLLRRNGCNASVERSARKPAGVEPSWTGKRFSKAYRAVERHARKRLRQWLCAKHHKQGAAIKQFPEASMHDKFGLVRLTTRTSSFPWATS